MVWNAINQVFENFFAWLKTPINMSSFKIYSYLCKRDYYVQERFEVSQYLLLVAPHARRVNIDLSSCSNDDITVLSGAMKA